LILAVFYPVGMFEEKVIWPVLARRSNGASSQLQLKSVRLGRFGHTFEVAEGGSEFRLTVYGPRRRVERALSLLPRPPFSLDGSQAGS
jgi:hypothetical protein